MVHVHARDEVSMRPATTTEVWLDVNTRIRARCAEIIINNTGGGPGMTMERAGNASRVPRWPRSTSPRHEQVQAQGAPDTLPDPHGEIIYDECVLLSYKLVSQFAARMKEYGVKPEMETYHSGGSWVMRDPHPAGSSRRRTDPDGDGLPDVEHGDAGERDQPGAREFPEGAMWLCSGIGPHQLPMTTLAIILGGHVRVGLEDNIYYRRGELVKSNAQLVERTVRLAHELGREVATPAQARAMLGLSPTPTTY
jgi:3-keto-5-aminohexanoate cleavage enzyme